MIMAGLLRPGRARCQTCEAAVTAVRAGRTTVAAADFGSARDRVLLGTRRPSPLAPAELATVARDLLTTHRDALDRLTAALLEQETVTGDQVRAIVRAAMTTASEPLPSTNRVSR